MKSNYQIWRVFFLFSLYGIFSRQVQQWMKSLDAQTMVGQHPKHLHVLHQIHLSCACNRPPINVNPLRDNTPWLINHHVVTTEQGGLSVSLGWANSRKHHHVRSQMSNICSHHIYMKMLLNLADHYNKASSEQIAVHSLLVACFCCSVGG